MAHKNLKRSNTDEKTPQVLKHSKNQCHILQLIVIIFLQHTTQPIL